MANNIIEMGNVVQLKSGGPKMTVSRIKDENVECTWFDKDNQKVVAEFNIILLHVPDPVTIVFGGQRRNNSLF